MQGRIFLVCDMNELNIIVDLGGKDFGCPLQIQKVNPSSLAERCGMQANDYIVKIGQTSAEHLKHPDAQDLIKQQDNSLELILQRYVERRELIEDFRN
jgi:C-terminal processing protease CtpA/Prc